MMTARSYLILSLLGSFALVAGCRQPSTSDVDQTEEGVLRLGSVAAVDTLNRAVAPNERPLVIEGFRGRVDLQGAEQETANLQFVRRARGEDAETARGVLEDVTISESGSEQNYTFTLESDGGAYAAVDVSGTVPRRTAVEVDQSSGPVTITDVVGAVTVSQEHGPVTVRGAAASVEAETKNGDVEGVLRSVPSDAEITLRTKNGDVTLRLPPDASVQVSAKTSVGDIRTQGLALTNQEFMPRDAGGEYAAQLGPGDAAVDLDTKNGSILLQSIEGDTADPDTTMEAPESEALSPPPSDTTVAAPSAPDTSTAEDTTMGAAASDTMR